MGGHKTPVLKVVLCTCFTDPRFIAFIHFGPIYMFVRFAVHLYISYFVKVSNQINNITFQSAVCLIGPFQPCTLMRVYLAYDLITLPPPGARSSFRLNNSRTTLGQHAAEHRKESNEIYHPKAGTRDFEKFLEFYNFNIMRKCKHTLETFINEGMLISTNKPKLNNMQSNGFTE